MPEFKCKIDPLDTSNEAPLVKFERDLELKLQSTVADDDLLSAFAIAILKGESQINGMKNDKATVITVNLDLGPIFEQVQRKILEEMKNAVTLITTGPLPTPVAPTVQVTTISHRLTDDSELKISFKVSGKDANQEEAVADILTDLGADAYRFPIDFTAVPAMEVPVVADFNNMLVGTIVKWRNAQARLKLAILDNLPDDIKTQMYELLKKTKQKKGFCRDAGSIIWKELKRRYDVSSASDTSKVNKFLTFCNTKRGQEDLITYLRRLQTVQTQTADMQFSNDMIYAHKALASLMAAIDQDSDPKFCVAYAKISGDIEASIKAKRVLPSLAIIQQLEQALNDMKSSSALAHVGKKRANGLRVAEQQIQRLQAQVARLSEAQKSPSHANSSGSVANTSGSVDPRWNPPKNLGFTRDPSVCDWCHICWKQNPVAAKFRGYNELAVTGIAPHGANCTSVDHKTAIGTAKAAASILKHAGTRADEAADKAEAKRVKPRV